MARSRLTRKEAPEKASRVALTVPPVPAVPSLLPGSPSPGSVIDHPHPGTLIAPHASPSIARVIHSPLLGSGVGTPRDNRDDDLGRFKPAIRLLPSPAGPNGRVPWDATPSPGSTAPGQPKRREWRGFGFRNTRGGERPASTDRRAWLSMRISGRSIPGESRATCSHLLVLACSSKVVSLRPDLRPAATRESGK